MESSRLYCKYTARPSSLQHIPTIVEKAYRNTIYGRPGPAYIDMPGDLLRAVIPEDQITLGPAVPRPPKCLPPAEQISQAAELIKGAKRPLIIVGKGAGYAQAEGVVRDLVDRTNLPVLATPMGKGLVSDLHKASVAPARTLALQQADVILLIGARLN